MTQQVIDFNKLPGNVQRVLLGRERYLAYAPTKPIVCKDCGKVYRGWRDLASHIIVGKKTHSQRSITFACKVANIKKIIKPPKEKTKKSTKGACPRAPIQKGSA